MHRKIVKFLITLCKYLIKKQLLLDIHALYWYFHKFIVQVSPLGYKADISNTINYKLAIIAELPHETQTC